MKVVRLTQLLPTAKEWTTKIREKAPLGVQRAKEAIIRGRNMALRNMTLEGGLCLEQAFFEEMFQSEDDQEGLRALAEKQRPEYKGR